MENSVTEKREEKRNLESIPVGSLRIIPMNSCKNLGERVDSYLVKWRTERENEHKSSIAFAGYQRDSYILNARVPRFGSGDRYGPSVSSTIRSSGITCAASTSFLAFL